MWRNTWLIAALGLRRSLRDRSILIQALLAPVVIALVVGAAFGSGFSLNVTIGIADADRSEISTQIAKGLVGSGGDGIAFSAVADPQSVQAAVESGSYDAVVVMPAGLGEAVLSGQDAQLDVVGVATQPLARSVAEAVAGGVAAELQTARVTAVAANEAGVEDVAASIQKAVASPPAITVEQGEVDGTFSVIAYFAPGMAMLFLFFIIGDGARSIVAERKQGTLPRILAAPVSPTSVLLGKTAQVMVVGVLSMTAVWLITWLGFGADWGDPVGVFVVIVAAVTAIAGISLLITGFARTENQADALTTIVALLFAVAGGTFFLGATGVLDTMRLFTPNGLALSAFVDLSAAQSGLAGVMPQVLLLLAIGIGTATAGLLALRNKVLS
ncbi:MAG: ABC transporter permease [Actinobacteria bacterium]|jgi:ABC-2 type transport system permease protein|nr:ABC transporter permease [Actinomycetota bacterium]MCB9427992.1 ABC transporter permease [Actinomycetota bacterium]MCO5301102.1 ABC transporter permease [Candidatus Nanopelagicales bacterium]HPQ85511.1 ABC transporter permease [Actinomycetota bacterium]